jgi:hypothetical protein
VVVGSDDERQMVPMASTEHLVAGSQTATGDENVVVAGVFLPRGFVGRSVVGSSIGGAFGDALGGAVGQAVGSAAGAAGGMGTVSGDGVRLIVAVSPTHVYVLRPKGLGGTRREDLELLHTFSRATLDVQVKARVTVRILVLEDREHDQRIELEGSRAHFKHANDVIHALVIDGHDDVPPQGVTEEEHAAATDG